MSAQTFPRPEGYDEDRRALHQLALKQLDRATHCKIKAVDCGDIHEALRYQRDEARLRAYVAG